MNVIVPVPVVLARVAVSIVEFPYDSVVGFAATVVVLAAGCTVTTTTPLAEPTKFVSPPYSAVMLCVPPVRVVVAKVATPLAIVPVPIVVPPSLKLTVPVAAVGTVAVKVVEAR